MSTFDVAYRLRSFRIVVVAVAGTGEMTSLRTPSQHGVRAPKFGVDEPFMLCWVHCQHL
jgi:hypothetical protein